MVVFFFSLKSVLFDDNSGYLKLARPPQLFDMVLFIQLIVPLYNYRLLMRSTHGHEDRVRYLLTDAEGGGQPIPDKVFMVMNRPKSKVYYCFIKLSGIVLHKD